MFLLLTGLLIVYACFLELTLQADLHHDGQTQMQVVLGLGGIHRTWRFSLLNTAEGHRLVLQDSHGQHPVHPARIRESRGSILFGALQRADRARRYLLRRIRLDSLDALLLLRTGDAARSALLSGAVQSVLSCIPAARRRQVRIRVLPEFFREHATLQARCIIRLRLGTLLLTGLMLLAAAFRERQQMKARQYYGTSHW